LLFEGFDLFFGVDFLVFEGFESAFRFRAGGFGVLRSADLLCELLLKAGYGFLVVFKGGFQLDREDFSLPFESSDFVFCVNSL